MRENGLTQADLAREMGVSLSRFNAKLNERGRAEFSQGEIKAMKAILRLTGKQLDQIFFA